MQGHAQMCEILWLVCFFSNMAALGIFTSVNSLLCEACEGVLSLLLISLTLENSKLRR